MTSAAFVAPGAITTASNLRGSPVAQPHAQRSNLAGDSSSFYTSAAACSAVAGAVAVCAAKRRSRVATKAVGIGINGFGRIGRQVARIAMKDPETELKLINASYEADYLAYMFKYDTIHGRYDGTIEVDGDSLVVDGHKIALSHTRDPADIPFGKHGADYVCESTGVFLTTDSVQAHLKAGAKKVIFSAPAKDDSHTVVMGVNEETYESSMTAVSCASCTTNGLAPAVKVLQDAYGIKRGLMTTCHAMTASQPTVDGTSKKDWRGGRAGPGNIIPSSTGAAKAVAKVIPAVKGKITGMALRVPTIDVSVVDLTVELEKPTSYEDLCAEMKRRSEGDMKGFLGYTDESLVSTDFETCPISCTFDSKAGIMLDPTFVKVVCWYDNEWGYSCRVVDLIKHMAKVDEGGAAAPAASASSGKKIGCVGIVGSSGAVGKEMLSCLEGRNFPTENVRLFAKRAAGDVVESKFGKITVEPFTVEAAQECEVCLMAVSGDFSEEFSPQIGGGPLNTSVIDNSSAFRYKDDIPLVIPEINGGENSCAPLVANPNCTTAIGAMALWPIHQKYKLKKVLMCTYQASSGAGAEGMAELEAGVKAFATTGKVPKPEVFAHQLPFNVIPQIDAFQENGYTKEEMKVTWELQKIFGLDDDVKIACTAVRVPTLRAHSESITIETELPMDPDDVRALLEKAEGVKVVDDPDSLSYPMPLNATGKEDVEVGRIRQSLVFGDKGLEFFVSGDQLLRGAALNAVIIAEQAVAKRLG